jgi:hypothetical protein
MKIERPEKSHNSQKRSKTCKNSKNLSQLQQLLNSAKTSEKSKICTTSSGLSATLSEMLIFPMKLVGFCRIRNILDKISPSSLKHPT